LSGITIDKISDFLHPFKSVQLFGASIELGSKTKTKSEDSIKELRREVQKKFDIASRKHGIRKKLELIYKQELTVWAKKHGSNLPKDMRITLHVPDLLFDETLYQLVDYYPN